MDAAGGDGRGPLRKSTPGKTRPCGFTAFRAADHGSGRAAAARRTRGENLPLFGVPFAVKDNIDVAGLPTTAACPVYAYIPQVTATVVDKLLGGGRDPDRQDKPRSVRHRPGRHAITLRRHATMRFDARYISGGSSSGSAVAVAAGLVSFSLGTDTAGSGRVPASFNNIVGLKPTRGRISTAGVVPACKSLDCVSVLALTCEDAATVAGVMSGYDPADPFSRKATELPSARQVSFHQLRFGVPEESALRFFGDAGAEAQYHRAVAHMREMAQRL